jgi:hypothetical protein
LFEIYTALSVLVASYTSYSTLYIPVTNQDACFSVLERFQFKATLCNKGYFLIKNGNDEVYYSSASSMGLTTIYSAVLSCKMEQPFYQFNTLSKSLLTLTEIMHFEW